MRFSLKKWLRKLNLNKRKIMTITVVLLIFVMSLGYAALSQHMDIDGIAQIDRNWIVKITNVTSAVTNSGVDNSKVYVGTTVTVDATLPTATSTVTYTVTLSNEGNIPAKLSTIEKIEDENYSIIYEISGVKESYTILNPGETNTVKVTLKYQSGVENIGNTNKELMLTFNYIENAGQNGSNSGDSSSNSQYRVFYPGEAVTLDPGDGTERLFYVVSTGDTTSSSTVKLLSGPAIGNSITASDYSTALTEKTSSWSKASNVTILSMNDIANLASFTFDSNKTYGSNENMMPGWLAGGTSGGVTILTSTTKNGQYYTTIKVAQEGYIGLTNSDSQVYLRPVITVSKNYLPTYQEYKEGDRVTTVDGNTWYVTKDSGTSSAMVTIVSSKAINSDGSFLSSGDYTRAFDTSGKNTYDTISSTNIGYFIENTFLPKIKNTIEDAGGNSVGLSARLMTLDELEQRILPTCNTSNAGFCNIGVTQGAIYGYWTMTPSSIDSTKVYYHNTDAGPYSGKATATSSFSVVPVITTLKSNITSVDLGNRIAKVDNTVLSDENIDFSKPTAASKGYKTRAYGNNSISFTAATTYYFGKSYKFNESTGKYSLDTSSSSNYTSGTWSSMSSNYSTYPYTCRSSSSTGTCSTMYKVNSYTSTTAGKGYTYTAIPMANVYQTVSTSTITSVSTTTSYKFGTSYNFDNSTGVFTLTGTVTTLSGADISSNYSTYKYMCMNETANTCTTLYYIRGYNSSSSIPVTRYTASLSSDKSKDLSNGQGLYVTREYTENSARTYYFRGNVTNNYVNFAGLTWRIVRINEDGSIRLITQDNVGDSEFNSDFDDNAYVGYMYGTAGSSTYAATHANTNNSTIKTYLDTWYQNNLASYSSYLADAGFCNDRSIASTGGSWDSSDKALGYGTNETYYGTYNRLNNLNKPQYACPKSNDLFTTSSSSKGNKALTYPIGLITADEVVYAGGKYNATNQNYYLVNGSNFWTMSPRNFLGGFAVAWLVDVVGSVSHDRVYRANCVRPVVNLASNVEIISGDGTVGRPYTIKVN